MVEKKKAKEEVAEKEEPKDKETDKKKKKVVEKSSVPKKTNLCDTATMKRILDDAAINVTSLYAPTFTYHDNFFAFLLPGRAGRGRLELRRRCLALQS